VKCSWFERALQSSSVPLSVDPLINNSLKSLLYQKGHPVPGGYKYGDLALQVRIVSDETVKYGREFCGTSTQE
jgi:hypothetical protein